MACGKEKRGSIHGKKNERKKESSLSWRVEVRISGEKGKGRCARVKERRGGIG